MDSFNKYAAELIAEHTSKLFPLGGFLEVKQHTQEAVGISEADSAQTHQFHRHLHQRN